MKNEDAWRPTKFVRLAGRLVANRDPREVSVSSRIIADAIAAAYEAALSQYTKGRLLDLGCGKAPLYIVYGSLAASVTCVDWSSSVHGDDFVDLQADLTKPIPLGNEAFDTIILSDVLEHIPDPEQLMSEIARLLAPGGVAVIGVPFFYWLHEEPFDYGRYTRHQLERFCSLVSLTPLSLQETGGAPEILCDIFGKVWGGRPGQRAVVRLMALLLELPIVRRISRSTQAQFPLGYVLVARKPPGD